MDDRRRRLRERTQRALDQVAQDRERVSARLGTSPRPGDVFVSRATTGHAVQWVLIDQDFQHSGRLRVVAADVNSLAGSTDVEIAAAAPCGALTVRCGIDLPLRRDALDPGQRTGVLADADLRRIQDKRREVDTGEVRATTRQHEIDEDPAYQDWIEEVEAAAVEFLWSSRELHAPVIDAESGGFDRPSLAEHEAADRARKELAAEGLVLLVSRLAKGAGQAFLGPDDSDLADLAQARWGIVFPQGVPQLRSALEPLVEHRRARWGEDRVRILDYHRGEGWEDWLTRHSAAAGDVVDPIAVPDYLLLVGSPRRIPFELQSVLSLQRAVGRVSFDDIEGYRRYAESVVAQENGAPAPAREVVFFAPRYRRDPVSRLQSDLIVRPLMGDRSGPGVAQEEGFATVRLWGEDATKKRLTEAFTGGREGTAPALLFAAAHALGGPVGDSRQGSRQGAILCQDWPGPGEPIGSGHYFSGEDLGEDARVHGTIVFLLSSYSAGMPGEDLLIRQSEEPAPRIAGEPFVARLPQKLLSHPRGGALAVIGLVDRVWGQTRAAAAGAERLQTLRGMLRNLLQGRRVGRSVRQLNRRNVTLTDELRQLLEQASFGKTVDDPVVATAWTERNFAQSFVVLGDPAVALRR